MLKFLKHFVADEEGAVTVDWVVLTGGILIFGVVIVASISRGATESSGATGNRLQSAEVPSVRWQ